MDKNNEPDSAKSLDGITPANKPAEAPAATPETETQPTEPVTETPELAESPESTPDDLPAAVDSEPARAAAAPMVTVGPKKSNKLWIALAAVLAIGAGAAAYFAFANSASDTADKAAVTAKKDIANIRFASTTYGWNEFYPLSDNTSTFTEANLAVFEGLVRFENKTQIVPLLATGWTNPDSETWVFNLKKDVKFHTGREMTAEDVKLSFESDAVKDSVWGETFANSIKSIEVSDPYQVTIKTDGPDPTLLRKLTNLHVYDTKAGKEGDPVTGTGPFVVKPGTTPGETLLELVTFDNYHGGRLNVRSLSFVGIDTAEDIAKQFNENKVNITDIPESGITRAHGTLTVEPNSVALLVLNSNKSGSPLLNNKVRQAIYHATDPEALAKVRDEDPLLVGQVIPPTIPGYNPEVNRPKRDVAKAKALLTEAGFPNGLTIGLTYFAPVQPTATEITRQLAEAGITLKADPQPDARLMGQKAYSGQADSFFQQYSSDILDASDVLATYSDSPNCTSQRTIDSLGKAQMTFDSSKRLSFLQEASRSLSEDLCAVPFYAIKTAPISYESSYVMQRDINSSTLIGVYWSKVYAK